MLKKNTAGQFIYFVLVSATDGSAVTGASPSGYQAIDGAAQGAIGGAITENALGQYEVALSQGDTNGDEIGYLFTNAGSVPVSITVTTETKKMVDLNDIAAGAAMNLAADAIKKVSYDESTAYALESADTGASQIARVGADGDTLEALSDQIDALPTDANVTTQCALALSNAHLDHLLLTAYAGEGTVGSILKDLLEDDAGTYRYTANALEQSAVGDATSAKQDEILVDLVDIKGTGFTKDVDSLKFVALRGADSDTLKTISDQLDAVPDAAGIESECNDALVAIHLDHLLAVDYDPVSKPGVATALLNELIENDAGVSRYTANALELAPGAAGDASAANQTLILEDLVDIKGSGFVKDTHSMFDIQTELVIVDGNVDDVETLVTTIDGKCDTISTAVVTTLDGIVDSILEDTGTTLNGLITTIDGIVDTIKDILEGDHRVNDATTPWQYEIRKNTDINWATPLVQQDLLEVDDTQIIATTQVIGQKINP